MDIFIPTKIDMSIARTESSLTNNIFQLRLWYSSGESLLLQSRTCLLFISISKTDKVKLRVGRADEGKANRNTRSGIYSQRS